MARVDKTESAVGVTRGTLAADIVQADWGKPIGVSINSSGLVVRGTGGTSGCVGVIIADKTNYKAGQRCDIFGNGSEIVETLTGAGTAFTPGVKAYAAAADGLLTATATSNAQVGYLIEADRLVVTL